MILQIICIKIFKINKEIDLKRSPIFKTVFFLLFNKKLRIFDFFFIHFIYLIFYIKKY